MRSKVTSESGNLATLDDFATKISDIAKEGRILEATISTKEARSRRGQNIVAHKSGLRRPTKWSLWPPKNCNP